MPRYSYDPRWITAKYPGTDMHGHLFAKGARVYYYPRTRQIVAGETAEQADRDFQAAAFDEAQITGNW